MNNDMFNPDMLARRTAGEATLSLNRIYNFIYGWMGIGLFLSGLVAWWVASAVEHGVFPLSRGLFTLSAIVELVLVFSIAFAIHKLPVTIAALMFALYSAINGITLSVIFLFYDTTTIHSVFFITAAMFAGLAVFGTVTRINLTMIGRICVLSLFGIVIASIANLFLGSSGFQSVISYIGVAVFVGLTAYDAQKIRYLIDNADSMDDVTVRRLELLCALTLYLDFINLFLFLLRILGAKGRD